MKGTGAGGKVLLLNLMVVAMKECIRACLSQIFDRFSSLSLLAKFFMCKLLQFKFNRFSPFGPLRNKSCPS